MRTDCLVPHYAESIVENISKLECTIDPNEIKKKDGVGAECTFETGQ